MAAEVAKVEEPSEQDKEFEVAQFLAGLATKTAPVSAQEEESVLPDNLVGVYSEPTLDECRHVTSELCKSTLSHIVIRSLPFDLFLSALTALERKEI